MLSSQSRGQYIRLFCDSCGRQTDHLTRITGHYVNVNTKRKVTDGVGWVCQTCLASIRKEDRK